MNKQTVLMSALLCAQITLFSSCDKTVPGCTDTISHSFNSEATEDDGSCKYYYGGKNMGQLDVGSEIDLDNEYTIYLDGVDVGRSLYYFPQGLNCANPQAVGKVLAAGSHTVKAVGNGGTEVRQGVVTLNQQECKVVLIENLPEQ